ncbi:hypothetical protein [Streptomyces sp. NPDC050738]|uniref:hypothetical protein n=1 Tax=Streptomyces sp. NPDC050738 TaxID=3154744 RepID=UPI003423B97C
MQTRTRRTAAAALAASALVLVAACGGGEDGKAKADASAPSAPAGPEPMTADQAKGVLVTAADLTSGWKLEKDTVIDPADASQYALTKPKNAQCTPLVTQFNTGRVVSDYKVNDQRVFADRAGKSFITQDVSGYGTAAAAQAGMKSLAAAVKACGTFSASYEGKPTKVTIGKFAVPALGDETLGFHLSIKSGDWVIDAEVASVRSGAGITSLFNNWGDGGERGQKAFNKALTKAAASLEAASPQA